jgi:hypothetical protein
MAHLPTAAIEAVGARQGIAAWSLRDADIALPDGPANVRSTSNQPLLLSQ